MLNIREAVGLLTLVLLFQLNTFGTLRIPLL